MIESHDSRVNKSFEKVIDREVENLTSRIEHGKQRVSGDEAKEKMQGFENKSGAKVTDGGLQQVERRAEAQGLSEDVVRGNINAQEKDLDAKHNKMMVDNKMKQENMERTTIANEKEFKETADQYDKQRTSKYWDIGGPGSAQKALDNFQKKPKEGAKVKK